MQACTRLGAYTPTYLLVVFGLVVCACVFSVVPSVCVCVCVCVFDSAQCHCDLVRLSICSRLVTDSNPLPLTTASLSDFFLASSNRQTEGRIDSSGELRVNRSVRCRIGD